MLINQQYNNNKTNNQTNNQTNNKTTTKQPIKSYLENNICNHTRSPQTDLDIGHQHKPHILWQHFYPFSRAGLLDQWNIFCSAIDPLNCLGILLHGKECIVLAPSHPFPIQTFLVDNLYMLTPPRRRNIFLVHIKYRPLFVLLLFRYYIGPPGNLCSLMILDWGCTFHYHSLCTHPHLFYGLDYRVGTFLWGTFCNWWTPNLNTDLEYIVCISKQQIPAPTDICLDRRYCSQ